MSSELSGLRPEARSVDFAELTLQQTDAFERVLRLLRAATIDLPSADEWRSDPLDPKRNWDEPRSSRVIFLDGDRGAGKTTVAASVRQSLITGDLGEAPTDERRKNDYVKAKEHLTEVGKRIILLDTLGMENAPADTNILAALLARIEQRLFPQQALNESSFAGEPDYHEAVLQLLRLQTDVALAWNGNLEQRMGRLDPDNYAMEELRVERVRLQLRDRFSSVLRNVARDTLHDTSRNPRLFLLVVDDVDLNPNQVMGLLDRLRMVGVPELAVLLIGDLNVLEMVFRLEYGVKFLDRGRAAALTLNETMKQEFIAETNGLALAALRKHVPSRQRVKLQLIDLERALDLVPLRRPDDNRKLRDLLGQLHVPLGKPATDEQWLALDQLMGREWYAGASALADSPRTVVDLWNLLAEIVAHDGGDHAPESWPAPPPGLLAVGEDECLELRAFFAQSGWRRLASGELPSEVIARAESAHQRDLMDKGNMSGLDIFARHTFDIPNDERPSTRVSRTRPGSWAESEGSGPAVAYTRYHGLEFYARQPSGPGFSLDPYTVGPLVLAEDLLSLAQDRPEPESIVVRSKLGGDLAWVLMYDGDPEERLWAIPDYRLVRQIQDFGRRWNLFLDQFTSTVATAEQLVLAWVMIHTQVLAGLEAHENWSPSSVTTKRSQDQVVAVWTRLHAEAEDRSSWAGSVGRDWLSTVKRLLLSYDLLPSIGSSRKQEAVTSLFAETKPSGRPHA